MSGEGSKKMSQDQAAVYQIRIKGQLESEWRAWFGDVTITQDENGDTLITGALVDQAALHARLRKVRDLGLTLISVIRLDPGSSDLSEPQNR